MEKFGYAGFRLFVFENGGVSHEGSCTGNLGKNQRLMQQRIAGWVSWFHPFQVVLFVYIYSRDVLPGQGMH